MFEQELAFAIGLAEEAGRIGMSFFRGTFDIREKVDKTPVTEADLAIEAMVRQALKERFPEDAVLGEEAGLEGASERRWIVDPIDGTKNFADGVQIWGTLIALAVDEVPVLGVVDAPALGERYEAARGSGARMNGEPIHVSRADRVDHAFVLHAETADWLEGRYAAAYLDLVKGARRERGFGDFWGHMLVARGSADVMLEPELATWDWAALWVIVEEAGGRVTTFEGERLSHGSSVLTTNRVLHDELVARLTHAAREAERRAQGLQDG
ncbi:MAG TPA: inositol monophosphatase family protein [Actinomycetota bacterium]|nr:inositol monophosphatase family protein [Actinomycetota bacterium]